MKKQDSVWIGVLSREDIKKAGYDGDALTDEQLNDIAHQLYWNAIDNLASHIDYLIDLEGMEINELEDTEDYGKK